MIPLKILFFFKDGYRTSATVACALLLYARALVTSEEAIALFTTRRCQAPLLQPSELRSLNYMGSLAQGICPHSKPLVLQSLLLQPVPLFTRARDGCRPYVEIHSGGALVFSTRRPDYEEMKLFSVMEGKVMLALGDATVRGDVTVAIFHARQQLGRIMGIKIASMQFHTGYIPVHETVLVYEKRDLDDVPDLGGRFKVVLNIKPTDDPVKSMSSPAPWEEDSSRELIPDPLFGSTLEMEETLENFRTNVSAVKVPEQIPAAQLPMETPSSNDDYDSLPQEEIQGEESEFYEADLLNLGMPDIGATATPTPAIPNPQMDIFSGGSKETVDLLGGFADFSQNIKTDVPTTPSMANDLLFEQPRPGGTSANDLLFDPLQGTAHNVNLLGGWVGPAAAAGNIEENFPRNASTPNFAAQTAQSKPDPFANLAGSLGAGLNSSWSGTPRDSNTPQSVSPAAGGTPVHSSPRVQRPAAPTSDLGGNETGVFNNKPAKVGGDAFGDLLGSQGYNFFSTRRTEKESPKTINEMRKVEAAKTMDPDRMKISEWTEGKKGNLRALLCSLHTVIWPEAERWQRCEMHQLVSAADVKKAYRRACLAVHPDKVHVFIT